MAVETLSDRTPEDRAKYLRQVWVECEEYFDQKANDLISVFNYIRGVKDQSTIYKTKLRHPYAFSVAQAIKSMIYPALFAADPVIQIIDPNPDNYPRNQILEELHTGHIKNPLRTNFPQAFEKVIDSLIWFGYSCPWTYFRSEEKRVGPRFEPVSYGGSPAFDAEGRVVLEEVYEMLRVYHAPWLEDNDVWDTFRHPDNRRGFTRRDVTGYSLLAQSKGPNPIYDPEKVARIINRELMSAKSKAAVNYHDGTGNMRDRDELAVQAGAEPPRHSELSRSNWAKDVLAKPFVLMHYDDGDQVGTYVVGSDDSFEELRWNDGASYDGQSNAIMCRLRQNPQEIFGTSDFSVAKDMLDFQTDLYRAAADATALQVHPTFLASQQLRMSGQQPVFGPGAIIWTPTVNRTLDEHFKRLEIGKDFLLTFQTGDTIVKRDLDQMFAVDDPQRGGFQGGRRTAYEAANTMQGVQGRTEVAVKKIFTDFVVPLVRKWTAMFTVHYSRRDYVKMLGSTKGLEYVPPTLDEIVSGLQYVPKGSITLADSQTRRAQWPAITDSAVKLLPYMQVPHIWEMFKRMLEDMGQEAVSRLVPSPDDPRFTEYQAKIMAAMQQQASMGGGPGGSPSPPKSPGDISGMLSSIGGGKAPPGPAGQGVPSNGFGRR